MNKIILFASIYSILLVIAAVIPTLGSMNKVQIEFLIEVRLDYFIHFFAYFGYFLLLIFSEFVLNSIISRSFFFRFSFAVVLFSIFTESLQLFITYRSFNPMDLFSNLVGVFFGITFYLIYYKYFMKVKLANFFKNKNYETANN